MRRGVFVTGTGTDVGKTIVAAAILRAWRDAGVDAAPMKPVQTGCTVAVDRVHVPDLDFSLGVAGMDVSDDERKLMAPFTYEPACSPHLAGRMAAHYPDIYEICVCADELMTRHDALVVEGAGGIMVPIDEERLTRELMQEMGLPVVLAAAPGLGTINHILLSIESLRSVGLTVAGVVFCAAEPYEEDYITRDNVPAVKRFGQVPIWGTIPHAPALAANDPVAWERALAGLTIPSPVL